MRSANTKPARGQIRLIECGMVAKTRPALILYYPDDDSARALAVVVPLTSQIRGEFGEVYIGKPKFLSKASAVNIQGIASFDKGSIGKLCGCLSDADFERVKQALRELLDL